MFIVIVQEIKDGADGDKAATVIERFRQTVDALDISRVIEATNYRPRAPRKDKGVARTSVA